MMRNERIGCVNPADVTGNPGVTKSPTKNIGDDAIELTVVLRWLFGVPVSRFFYLLVPDAGLLRCGLARA